MGKPYKKEVESLESTYHWALGVDVSRIAEILSSTFHLPLFSIGPGGSYSLAEFQTTLHRSFFQTIAHAITPMELISALPSDGNASVWFFSANGNNVDILRSFKHASLNEVRSISAVIGKENSKLAKL